MKEEHTDKASRDLFNKSWEKILIAVLAVAVIVLLGLLNEKREVGYDKPDHFSEEYDPYRDPNANLCIRFEADTDGAGSWFVYNEDNDSRIRLSEIEIQGDSADV